MAKFRMEDWTESARQVSPRLADALYSDRITGLKAVEEIGLPHYNRKLMQVGEFMSNPDVFTRDMDCGTFFVTLIPKAGGRRFSEADLDVKQVIYFVRGHLHEAEYWDYDMALQQYFENIFGGNIIANSNGMLLAEFRRGRQGPIGSGTVIPEFYVTRNSFTGSFRYSFENPDMREMIYKTIIDIPHEGNGRAMKFQQGYYEFVIVNRDGRLRPIFIDYKDSEGFRLPDNMIFDASSRF